MHQGIVSMQAVGNWAPPPPACGPTSCCYDKGIAAQWSPEAKIISLLLLRVLDPHLQLPMLFLSSPCSQPPPAFSGCGRTHWDGLLVQRLLDVGMEESHAGRAAAGAVSIQGKSHSGELQFPPPLRCLPLH